MYNCRFKFDLKQEKDIIKTLPEVPLMGEVYSFNINGKSYNAEVYDIVKCIEVENDKVDFYYSVLCTLEKTFI